MKKAFDFLNDKGVDYEFFDYKKQVLSQETFVEFVGYFGLDKLINKQGTTYRKLSDDDKVVIGSGELVAIYELVRNNQSLLKRPVVVGQFAGELVRLLGFNLSEYEQIFQAD